MTEVPGPRADYLHWAPRTSDDRLVDAWWTNAPVGYLMFWGDNTPSESAGPNNAVMTHRYNRPGAYMLEAKELNGKLMGYAQVIVPPNWDMAITHGPSEANPELYEVRFGEVDSTGFMPRFRVNWRDGAPNQIEEKWGIPGDTFTRKLPSGSRTISVYDIFANNYRHYRGINITDVRDPDYKLSRVPDDPERTLVSLELTNVQAGKPVTVWWGDQQPPQVIADPAPGSTVTHRLDPADDLNGAGTFAVEAFYADDRTTRTRIETVTVPFPAAGSPA